MKTPLTALSWELWRRNRFGFAALLGLLALCTAVAAFTKRLEQRSLALEGHNPNFVILPASTMLRPSPPGPVSERIVLKAGAKLIFDGLAGPNDQFEITALFEAAPQMRVVLRNPTWAFPPPPVLGEKAEVSAANPGSAASDETNRVAQALPNPSTEKSDYEGPLPPSSRLTWSAADGRMGDVALAFQPDYAETIVAASARAERWRSLALAASIVCFTFSVFAVFAIFGAAEPIASRGFTGIPPRRFTLPVRTSSLVAVPLILGWITLTLTYLAWSHVVLQPLSAARGSTPDLYLLLLLSAGLSSFQALVWGLPSFPKLRAFLITILVLALFTGAVIPFDAPLNRAGEPLLMALCGMVWLSTIGMAWLGVRLERRGFWSDWSRSDPAADSFHLVLPTVIQFAGPLHAQCWMEWRRNGRMAVAVTGLLAIVLLACALAFPFGEGRVQTLAGALLAVLSFAMTGWVGIAGLNLARDGSSRALAMSSFTAVRPVSAGIMLEAKLIVALVVWLIGALAFSVVWIVPMLFYPSPPVGWVSFWCFLLALSAHLYVGILPLCLSGKIPGFPWSFLPWLVLYGGIANVAFWFGDHPHRLSALVWVCAMALLVKLLTAAWAFSRGIQRRLISPVFVGVYVVLWLMATSGLMRLALGEIDSHGWEDGMMALIPGAALIIPLARVALSPLALARNRHR